MLYTGSTSLWVLSKTCTNMDTDWFVLTMDQRAHSDIQSDLAVSVMYLSGIVIVYCCCGSATVSVGRALYVLVALCGRNRDQKC